MKKFLSLSLLLLPVFNIFSQSFKVSFSDEFKIVEKFNRDKVFKNPVLINNCIYSAVNTHVEGGGKWLFTKIFDAAFSLQVSKFDKNMKLIKQLDLENGAKSFAPMDPILIDFNGTLLLAYYKPFNKTAYDLFISSVDMETLNLSKPVKIMTIPVENVGLFKLEEELRNAKVNFELSPDKTKLLLTRVEKTQEATVIILNKYLQVEKQTKVILPGSKFYLNSQVINNNNFVCLAFNSEKEDNLIVSINANGKKTESKIIPLSNGLISNEPYLNLSKDQNTVYVYSTVSISKQDYKFSKGILFSTLDTLNTKMAKPKIYEFGPDFYKAICEKGGGEKYKREQRAFNFIPRLTELENGNLIICGSPEISTTKTYESTSFNKIGMGNSNNSGTYTTRTTMMSIFEAGSIVSFFINKSSPSFNFSVIPRDIFTIRSDSREGGFVIMQAPRLSHNFSGFFVKELKDKIVFVYDDYGKNVEQDLNSKTISTSRPGNYVLAEAAIDNNGNILYRKKIADDPKGTYTYYLSESLYGPNNSYLIPIGKQGNGFSAMREFYNQWCILEAQ